VVQQADPTTLLRIVISGVRSAATDAAPTGPAMPSFGWRLSDRQVADVLTYVRNSWGNAATPVSEAQSRRMRRLSRVQALQTMLNSESPCPVHHRATVVGRR
jgi:mono/diheme cytochrome c family protein